MMVPGVLGKFGRAYDQLTSVTKNDVTKNSDVTTAKIRKHFAFVVSKMLTSYMPGIKKLQHINLVCFCTMILIRWEECM